jgi:hypothetical protein
VRSDELQPLPPDWNQRLKTAVELIVILTKLEPELSA